MFDLVDMIEYIGPSSTQVHYVSYILSFLLQSLSNEQSQFANTSTDKGNNKIIISSLKLSSTNKSGKENKSPLPKASQPHIYICPKCKKEYQHKQSNILKNNTTKMLTK